MLESSRLFVCVRGLIKYFGAWKGQKQLLGCGLLGGISTQTDTVMEKCLRPIFSNPSQEMILLSSSRLYSFQYFLISFNLIVAAGLEKQTFTN